MDLPLLDWLQKYALPTESGMSDLSKAKEVYSRLVRQTLRQGTTTASYFSSIHAPATKLLAEICLAAGQRAFIGKCNMNTDLSPDWYRETHEESMASTRDCIQHCRQIDPTGEHIKAIITPRFAPSCTSDLLHDLGKLAHAEKLPIQTHISENLAEIDMVADMFPNSAHYTGVYDDHGLLTDKTILAHAVHLSDEELALIKKRGAGIAHCPASNTALQSGEAPIREMLDLGLNVGLGTDVSGGYTASVLDQAKLACGVSRHRAIHTGDKRLILGVEEAIYMATLGGAKVCGISDRLGNFLVGKCFDALLIDLSSERNGRVEIFDGEEDRRIFDKWVFNGDDRNIAKIWVDGLQVL
ncbi:hypothetical protein BCR37DRAFT_378526 [Protomyces lactucae-debilis]|uniref:Probable guanine deaminase n=1 Tax=Protomyces lactucae-debilis TaxID=2754530 RepID=A0A1Y2FKK7_PROLT|nr:uncharacterized protein BCR37DRAFT_378526 [Protomyces lactucae-debilis]ORY84488.1 hypothetical protein BCR37DRAFT_378526 [Protomyces lactucae-debilis]